ncbi:MAG: hypothetical protein E7328_00390 [Clostridiales bacterium]|nr:hypothetical protein [Clostridiales bacterium]
MSHRSLEDALEILREQNRRQQACELRQKEAEARGVSCGECSTCDIGWQKGKVAIREDVYIKLDAVLRPAYEKSLKNQQAVQPQAKE